MHKWAKWLKWKMVWLVGVSIMEDVDSFYVSIVFIFSSIHTHDLSFWFGFHGLSWGQQFSCSWACQLQTADFPPTWDWCHTVACSSSSGASQPRTLKPPITEAALPDFRLQGATYRVLSEMQWSLQDLFMLQTPSLQIIKGSGPLLTLEATNWNDTIW